MSPTDDHPRSQSLNETLMETLVMKWMKSLRPTAVAGALSMLCVLSVGPAAWAQPQVATPAATPTARSAPPTLAEFFKRSEFNQMVASPDGKFLATTMPVNGRLNLVVIDLTTRESKALTGYNNIDVGGVQWAGNDYLVFRAVQVNAPSGQDTPRAGGFFSAARDGSDLRQHVKTASQMAKGDSMGYLYMDYVGMAPGSNNEIIANVGVANDDSLDLYRVNLTNGRARIITQGRPIDRITRWVMDGKGVARVAVASAKGAIPGSITMYRSGPDAPWVEINSMSAVKPPAFVPLRFDTDDKHLIVSSNHDRKNMALFRFDPETKKFVELLAQHPQYDLGASPVGNPLPGSLVIDPATRALVGIRVDADKPQMVWLDDKMTKAQATVDGALKGRTNRIQRSPSGQYLVYSFSDTEPGAYFLFDEAKRQLQSIGPTNPWLQGKLAEVKPFMLKTRDGLEIPSYYVLPKGYQAGSKKLTTILHIHGGPHARDVELGGLISASFGVLEAQILASQGYAVVLPNFRITPELGSNIYYAGFGTYGRQMIDDHEDAAKWAVDQGFADPKKMCISGASYGGYAALRTVQRPSNPFACSIVGLPSADIVFQQTNADYAREPRATNFWLNIMGVKDLDDPIIKEISPINHADKIKVPVFMYVGEEDTRTPPKQAERMAEALKAAGNPVKDYYVGKGEGHGYGVDKNNIELYERMLKFLKSVFPD
jgi:dipeptidyl aminopeptidase/acylaminoacyl peptidase